MPEHVHLLVSEPKVYPLKTTLNVLKAESSKILKGTRPQFWQTRYYDFNVFTHGKWVEKLQYIHRNPVTRGLVEKPEHYRWSSFNHWAIGELGPVEVESHWTWTRRERAGTPPIAMQLR
jgi:putative transposase